MSTLKMPRKGQSAAMMAELQAEHATAAEHGQGHVTNVTTLQPSPARTNVPLEVPVAEPLPPPPEPTTASADRAARLATAQQRALSDEIAVVTVRVPAVLNRYMDEYVARLNRLDPKRRYRKQDAVLEAFAAFYADHPLPPAADDESFS